VAELDSAGNVIARFAGGYMVKGSDTYQLVTDHLGSVRLVVDVVTGTIAQRLSYDEYGNVLNDSNPDFQPFAYAGGIYETQTKLVRFGVRDYEAISGRWTAVDRLKFKKGSSNLYIYCHSDPINFIDIDGFGDIKTSKGRKIEYLEEKEAKEYFDSKNIPVIISEEYDSNDQPRLNEGLIKTGPAGTYQNCHGWAYRPDDDVWINDPTVIIKDDYDPILKSEAQPGDRVTWYYHDDEKGWLPYHSGVVYDEEGGIESKFVANGRYLGWGCTELANTFETNIFMS